MHYRFLIPLPTSVVTHEVSRSSLACHRHHVNGGDASSRSLSPSCRVVSYVSNPSPINWRGDSLRFSSPYNTCKSCESSYRLRFQGLFTLLTSSSSRGLRILFQIRAFWGFALQSFIHHKDSHPFRGPYSRTVESTEINPGFRVLHPLWSIQIEETAINRSQF